MMVRLLKELGHLIVLLAAVTTVAVNGQLDFSTNHRPASLPIQTASGLAWNFAPWTPLRSSRSTNDYPLTYQSKRGTHYTKPGAKSINSINFEQLRQNIDEPQNYESIKAILLPYDEHQQRPLLAEPLLMPYISRDQLRFSRPLQDNEPDSWRPTGNHLYQHQDIQGHLAPPTHSAPLPITEEQADIYVGHSEQQLDGARFQLQNSAQEGNLVQIQGGDLNVMCSYLLATIEKIPPVCAVTY